MSIELWGGVECTVNRVGDRYFDQMALSGHDSRPEDLEMFASLGIKKLRYPILWERTAPDHTLDWRWADERLNRIRKLKMEPIAGLLHHGSGPAYTSLVDPAFADKFASYARAFAERYPWVEYYTPVNEPLTTARFSGLYGHWFPHGGDARTFVTAMLMQCRAVVQAMREVRKVNTAGRLVQTEDLGKTFSTEKLRYQAEFENVRRWLTFDLLSGSIGPEHPLWCYLRMSGASERDLLWFRENQTAPDIIGVNHYLTSQRYLDEMCDLYPACHVGGNGQHRYADVEAVRVGVVQPSGPGELIQEVWTRYHKPIAITEVHVGCTSEEQLRWFRDFWEAAVAQKRSGADVRAVTAWALLGAYNWNSLVTRDDGHYEPGVFDLRSGKPRATALAHMLRDISAGRPMAHPALSGVGWWARPVRVRYKPNFSSQTADNAAHAAARPILITGAGGTLGYALLRACSAHGLAYCGVTRQDLDITDTAEVSAALDGWKPWAVINAAGYVWLDLAEAEPERCFRINTEGTATLARECARQGVRFVTFSSDLVFDGEKSCAYVESDAPRPMNTYGRSKAQAEARVLEILDDALVIRTAAFFGPWDQANFVTQALKAIVSGQQVMVPPEATVTPTYVPDLARATLNLLVDGELGIWHLTNSSEVTWTELARLAAECASLERSEFGTATRTGTLAKRPVYRALGSERGRLLPSLEDAMVRYVGETGILREIQMGAQAHFEPQTRTNETLSCPETMQRRD